MLHADTYTLPFFYSTLIYNIYFQKRIFIYLLCNSIYSTPICGFRSILIVTARTAKFVRWLLLQTIAPLLLVVFNPWLDQLHSYVLSLYFQCTQPWFNAASFCSRYQTNLNFVKKLKLYKLYIYIFSIYVYNSYIQDTFCKKN